MPNDPYHMSIFCFHNVQRSPHLKRDFQQIASWKNVSSVNSEFIDRFNICSEGYVKILRSTKDNQFMAVREYPSIYMNDEVVRDPKTQELMDTFYIFVPHAYNYASTCLAGSTRVGNSNTEFVMQSILQGGPGMRPCRVVFSRPFSSVAIPKDFDPQIHSYVDVDFDSYTEHHKSPVFH